jgi:ParB-like chromosome segregation protein Spo0J
MTIGAENILITLSVGVIKKSNLLEAGVTEAETESYERLSHIFGNVTPIIVRKADADGMYECVHGQAALEGLIASGQRDVLAVVADIAGEKEGIELALCLATITKGSSAIMEALMIVHLFDCFKMSRKEVMEMTGKSKSWVSKRVKIAKSLHPTVQQMALRKLISVKTAEHMTNLPTDRQPDFARNVLEAGLGDNEVSTLVRRYNGTGVTEVEREQIINHPGLIAPKEKKKRRGGRSARGAQRARGGQALPAALRYLIKTLEALSHMAAEATSEEVAQVTALIDEAGHRFADVMTRLNMKVQ